MDYAIYKTNDGKHPRVIHRFTQKDCDHKAKRAAIEKLNEMWMRVAVKPTLYRNAVAVGRESFSYDHPTSTYTTERIRFYIAKL